MKSHFLVASYVITGGFGALVTACVLHYLTPHPMRGPIVTPPVQFSQTEDLRTIKIPRGDDLSFRVPVDINGNIVEMLFDTGANVTVLTRDDAIVTSMPSLSNEAKHLDVTGINSNPARFRKVGDKSLKIGSIHIASVPMAVDDTGDLSLSILGQNAFCNIREISIRGQCNGVEP